MRDEMDMRLLAEHGPALYDGIDRAIARIAAGWRALNRARWDAPWKARQVPR